MSQMQNQKLKIKNCTGRTDTKFISFFDVIFDSIFSKGRDTAPSFLLNILFAFIYLYNPNRLIHLPEKPLC